jgi:hypothetical protein
LILSTQISSRNGQDVAETSDGSGRGDEGPFGGFNILDQFNIAANRSRAST